MEWFLKALRQYSDFNGRARRKEYWMFVLFNIIFSFVAGALDQILGTGGLLSGLYILGLFIPGLAVSVRRLHDIDKSGWMLLVALIPIVGSIWLIVLLATEGTYGDNQYGPDPKQNNDSSILDADF